jgi:signal transduction histidine kinase
MLRFITQRIQVKLVLVTALALLIPTMLIGVYSINAATTDLLRTVNEKNLQLVASRSSALLTLMAEGERDVLLLVQAPPMRQYVGTLEGKGDEIIKRVLISHLKLFLVDSLNHLSVQILSHTGHEILGVERNAGIVSAIPDEALENQADQLYFIEAIRLTGHVYISGVDLNGRNRKPDIPYVPVIRFSLPLYTEDGGLVGVIVLKSAIWPILTANTNSNGVVYIVGEDGSYLAHPDPTRLFGQVLKTGITFDTDQPENAALLNDKTKGTTFTTQNGSDALQAFASVPIPNRDDAYWTFIYEEKLSNVFREINNVRLVNIILATGALLVALSLAWFVTRSIVKPVRQLADVSVAISRGEWDVQIPVVKNRDEVGALARAFSRMSRELKALYGDLETRVVSRTSELETVAKVSAAVAAILDIDKLLETISDLTKANFDLSHVYIYLLDDSKANLILADNHMKDGKAIAEYRRCIPLVPETPAQETTQTIAQHSIVAQAALSLQGVVANDTKSQRQPPEAPRQPSALHSDSASEMAIPLISAGRLLGVLDLQSPRANRFTDTDLRVMSILGDQIAVALQNAYLYNEQIATARQLEDAQHRAEQASRAKSTFLSNMSHELRTPLNVIIGYTSSMLDRPAMYNNETLPPIYGADIKLINESAYHLVGLINDILDLSKIEAGKLELHQTAIDLSHILRSAIATSSGLVKEKPVQLHADFCDLLPPVWADPIRVRQIILNLIANAIKFTERGSITVQACQEQNFVKISVIDTGIGIPEKALATIFDRFEQADKNISRRFGGTGLGLDISKQLCQMLGGDLTVQSAVGKGSIFSFTLPLAPSEPDFVYDRPEHTSHAAVNTAPQTPQVAAPYILLIEDNQENADMMIRLLNSANYRVQHCLRGFDGAHTALNTHPDVILMDFDLPDIDGRTLTATLKKQLGHDTPPIIAVTARAGKDEARLAEQSGCSAFVSKPFAPEALLKVIEDVLKT